MADLIYSASMFRDSFLAGAARALFACAASSYLEEQKQEGADTSDLLDPGPGGDWYELIDAIDMPPQAYALAGELWAGLEFANQASVYQLAQRAERAEPDGTIDPVEFGDRLAWEAMGSGIAWTDDHPDVGIKVPPMEVSGFTFDPACYRDDQ